ncbi:hypothetical protein RKD46_000492 [Streptomyces pseudovenezuelae]
MSDVTGIPDVHGMPGLTGTPDVHGMPALTGTPDPSRASVPGLLKWRAETTPGQHPAALR